MGTFDFKHFTNITDYLASVGMYFEGPEFNFRVRTLNVYSG